MRRFFLELFNHPYRTQFLLKLTKTKFIAPPKIDSEALNFTQRNGMSVSIGDLGSVIAGADKSRISRKERYAQGPFVKLGKQARMYFVGSASPDVWNSAIAIATMAASHCLTSIPRNGLLSDAKRQADLAEEVFKWLDNMADEILGKRKDRKEILK